MKTQTRERALESRVEIFAPVCSFRLLDQRDQSATLQLQLAGPPLVSVSDNAIDKYVQVGANPCPRPPL